MFRTIIIDESGALFFLKDKLRHRDLDLPAILGWILGWGY
jgi:hypothetical protein